MTERRISARSLWQINLAKLFWNLKASFEIPKSKQTITMKQINYLICLLVMLMMVTACTGTAVPKKTTPTVSAATETAKQETIVLMSHDSFDVSAEVMTAFEKSYNVKVEVLKAGDAGASLNKAILSKEQPMADVFFGVDNTFLSRALDNNIFEPYDSPLLADVSANLKLDPKNRLLPIDFGDVCLNYDKEWFIKKGITPPNSLEDLLKKEYNGLMVVENPATSSPGLAFLLATVAHFGDPGYLDFWQKLKAQNIMVVDGWEEAYYNEFTRYKGTHPIVLSYASSPAAEVYFAEKPLTESPTAAMIAAGTCFRQIEFVGILAGTPKRKLAENLIDFMLAVKFQEDIPLKMFVFPSNQKATLPELFLKYGKISDKPATIAPDDIAANREKWLTTWTETVLR